MGSVLKVRSTERLEKSTSSCLTLYLYSFAGNQTESHNPELPGDGVQDHQRAHRRDMAGGPTEALQQASARPAAATDQAPGGGPCVASVSSALSSRASGSHGAG